MFKLRCNNKILSEHDTLFEAKKNTLLSLKKDPSLKLIEVLNENDEIVYSNGSDEPTPQEVKVGVDTVIRNLITRCWDTVTEVESVKVTLENEQVDPATFDILNDIIDDNYRHIGVLEGCLSDNVEK